MARRICVDEHPRHQWCPECIPPHRLRELADIVGPANVRAVYRPDEITEWPDPLDEMDRDGTV